MSTDFVFRLIGMVGFTILGVLWGTQLGRIANVNSGGAVFSVDQYAVTFGLVGALVGLILTPYLTTRPVRAIRSFLVKVSAQTLFSGLIGLIAGLTVAVLLSFPLSRLPSPFGQVFPFLGVLLFSYLGVSVFLMRQNDLSLFLGSFSKGGPQAGSVDQSAGWAKSRTILLDTSVIIDGRIADIARTGFLPGSLLIPRFVLNELQYIADSPDSLRRQRGRRGMEVLSQLQKEPVIPVRITDIDVEGVRDVDDKLVILARQLRCPILTNDYNLNRVAELQGVNVLNVNELANAVKSVLLPGEALSVRVIQEGKESGQGVGYMDDGTMVVIEIWTKIPESGNSGHGDQSTANRCRAHDFCPSRKRTLEIRYFYMREIITGRNPVFEVFQSRRRQIFRLLVAVGVEEKGHLAEVIGAAAKMKIPVERVQRQRLDNFSEGHQGVAVEVSEYPFSTLPDIIAVARKLQEPLFVLLLDMLQNPQNLGTLLRTAEVAGIHGIVIPFNRAASVTPAVVHASSGATEHLLVAQMNLAQAIDSLKAEDAWVVGLEGGPESRPLTEAPLAGPLALVVGNEGEGMRQLVRNKCDFLGQLPMRGRVDSLNAAVAGSIAIYMALQARLPKPGLK